MTAPAAPLRRVSVLDLAAAKRQQRPLAMVTAYDWPTGRLVDEAGVDCVLVGDSVAMVVAGRDSTIPATLDQMIYHGEIVSRAVSRAMVAGTVAPSRSSSPTRPSGRTSRSSRRAPSPSPA